MFKICAVLTVTYSPCGLADILNHLYLNAINILLKFRPPLLQFKKYIYRPLSVFLEF